MPTLAGTPVNFGFTGPDGVTISGLTGLMLLQSVKESSGADNERARNGVGDVVTSGWYDQHKEAVLEWVITAGSSTLAIAATTLTGLLPGTILTITASVNVPDLLAGSKWEVMSSEISGENTSFKKISLTIQQRAGVTATIATT